MAGYNELLVGRYNRAMQKLLSMKGKASLESLNPELQLVIASFYGAENRYLEGWNRFGIQVQQNGAAGVNTGMRMRNPTGANVVVVIEKLCYANFTATGDDGQVLVGPATTDLTTSVSTTNARFDPRGNPQPSVILSSQTNPPTIGAGTAKAAWSSPTLQNYDVVQTDVQEFPLLPGDAMQVQSVAFNQQINVSVWWRERALEESERT